MEIKISGRHIEITPAIHDYAESKCSRFRRYFDRIQEITLVVDKHDRDLSVEIIVDVEHHDPFVARGRDDDLYLHRRGVG